MARLSVWRHGRREKMVCDPTMEDVAKAAGGWRLLVSLVYQNSPKVSAQSRRQVERAAVRLGYRPNEMVRRLASGTTRTFGVLLNDMHNPVFAEVHDGVQTMIEESDYKLLMGTGDRDSRCEAEFISTVLDRRVDGLVMLSPRIPDAELLDLVGTTQAVMVGRATHDRPLGVARSYCNCPHKRWRWRWCERSRRGLHSRNAFARPREEHPHHRGRIHGRDRKQRGRAAASGEEGADCDLCR